MLIIGIDIAKNKHEAAIVHQSGKMLGNPFPFPNSIDGINKLIQYIDRYNKDHQPIVFGMEATGHYWLPLYSWLVSEGYTVHVINPIQSDSLRNLYIRQTKTDSIDAFIIAEVIRFGRFAETTLAEPDMFALRQLCRYRLSLVDNISDLKRKVIAVLDQVFPEYQSLFSDTFGQSSKELLQELTTPEEILAIDIDKLSMLLTESSKGRLGRAKAEQIHAAAKNSFGIKLGIDALTFQIRQLIAQIKFMEEQLSELDSKINNYYQRFNCTIDTMPGVSNVLGAIIVSEIGDISRFSAPSKLVAFAGIDPSVKQSGNFSGTHNHMSKRGSSYLRRAVWMAATVSVHYDPVMTAFYQKKRSEGKAYRTAIGAVCRKMLYVIFALLKSGETYIPKIINKSNQ
jgi:transposase